MHNSNLVQQADLESITTLPAMRVQMASHELAIVPVGGCDCHHCDRLRQRRDRGLTAALLRLECERTERLMDARIRPVNERQLSQLMKRRRRHAQSLGLDRVAEIIEEVAEFSGEGIDAAAAQLARRLWDAAEQDLQRLAQMQRLLTRQQIADVLDHEFPGNIIAGSLRRLE